MRINKKTSFYIGFIFLAALSIYGYIFLNYPIPDIKMLLFWSVLAIVVESLLIKLPNSTVGVSVGSAINLAAIIVGGPLLGTTASLLGFLFRIPKIEGKGYVHLFNTPFFITIFNVSQNVIVSGIMGLVYIYSGGGIGKFSFLPAILILFLGMGINTIIISGLMSLLNKQKFITLWASNMKGTLPSSLAIGTMGIIIALASIGYGYWAVILFFGPLLLARYSFRLYIEMRNLYISTIHTLNKAVEAKDPYTSGHSARVEEYSIKLAEAYGLPYDKIEDIKTAAILHDIGKIAIHDSILHKASKLTEYEMDEIRKHPSIGADIISKMDFFKDVTEIIRYHHERYDGKGYPEGISGEDIPVEACILSIVDSFDAMTSDRPYREALSKEEALKEIEKNAGTQFHPNLAIKFVEIMSN